MRKKISSQIVVQHVQANSSIYLFIITLFLMGVIFGAIVVNSLSLTQKEDLFYYLQRFFGQVSEGQVAVSQDIFQQSFLHNVKYLGFIWILGASIIGLPLIFVFLFMKGVVVGFSVGFLVNQMGWKGFFISFATVLPQNLFIIPAFIFIAASAVAFSLQLIRKIFIKNAANYHITPLFTRYVIFFILAVGITTVAASVEAYISPTLMKMVIK
ncbi:stage II sporulation protein M [Oikeobacillus pervagus]|uniref:Stage II sporulation protein M n=1 Tax=Oikeobacillus pervagus TaxID=1325931 RepID=A0AAJ1WHX4_9BACI|nr:stage II sporulation protein M [Oikeobacillus pervagus]MDQ0213763.1 stage II sporulation protein M [Oikeobacillus pervagus]